jgi:hypothetical protein
LKIFVLYVYYKLPVKAKPAVRRGRKTADLFKEEKMAGLPGRAIRFCVFPEDDTMNKRPPPMIKSAWLLVFSYVKYFANDPTFLPLS